MKNRTIIIGVGKYLRQLLQKGMAASYAKQGKDVERSMGGIQWHGRIWCHIGARLPNIDMDYATYMARRNTKPFVKGTKKIERHQGILFLIMLGQ